MRVTHVAPSSRKGRVPELPPDARVWRDWGGIPRAYGFTVDGVNWMCWPGVGAFRFGSASGPVEAIVPDSIPTEVVEETYRRSVLPFILQARGEELLHASAVRGPRGAIAFCGSSGAGKSTLARSLGERGFQPIADDSLRFELADDGVDVRGTPFEASSRNGTEDWIQLTDVFVVEPVVDPKPELELARLSKSDALQALLYHALCFSDRDSARVRLMIERYLRLTDRVRTFRLRYQRGLGRLPALLDAVERVVE